MNQSNKDDFARMALEKAISELPSESEAREMDHIIELFHSHFDLVMTAYEMRVPGGGERLCNFFPDGDTFADVLGPLFNLFFAAGYYSHKFDK